MPPVLLRITLNPETTTSHFVVVPGWTAPADVPLTIIVEKMNSYEAVYLPAALPAPENVSAASGPLDVLIQWDEQTLYTVNGYHVYRSKMDTKEANRLTAAPVRALRYEDDGAQTGVAYEYYVTAVGINDTESAPSESVSVVAGDVVLQLSYVAGLPGEMVRIPVFLGNAFGLSSETLSMDVVFYNCDTNEPIDVFQPGTIRAVTTAITADMNTQATLVETGTISIEAAGTAGTVLTGEGRLIELEGTLIDTLALDQIICVRLEEAELLLGDAALGVSYEQGALVITDECMRGDVNNSREVESGDPDLVLRIATKHEILDECRWQAGNLNLDNHLNTADATIILRLIDHWYDDPQQDGTPTLADILLPQDGLPPLPLTVTVDEVAVTSGR